MNRIHHYLDEIKSGILSKAILSRVIQIEKPQQFDVTHFYTLLASAYPETFVSLFYIPGMGIWTGATPELLLEKENKTYRTMALASTQPKKAIGDYSWRNKEKEEHRLVQQHIEEVFLKNDCQLTDSKGPYTIESGQVAHLKTDYTFEEKNPDNQNNITDQLHPTPAIGGLPVDASLECIKKYEGYNRNYYSGYLGETNHRDLARLFINLRCMQIGKDKIAIFAGGGISIDSDPEEEWAETNQKSLTLLEIIEETTRHHA
ncbi:MAG: chorismate-binding protein [Ginsengibacter sp.]